MEVNAITVRASTPFLSSVVVYVVRNLWRYQRLTLWFLYSPRIARSLAPQPGRSAFRVCRYRPGIGGKGIESHVHSHKNPFSPTRRCQLRIAQTVRTAERSCSRNHL
jgi:hypothetical protein